ncbi:MAG: HlyU family transcriptional regulator [Pseudomonadota bacterium]
MSLFSKLFGGSAKSTPDPVAYEGFDIIPDPIAEGGKYRLSARIEKTVGDERKTHLVIRADVFDDRAQAESFSVAKAKQVIDEQGDKLFS